MEMNTGADSSAWSTHVLAWERSEDLLFSSSFSVIPPSPSWFPPMVYYYSIIASICLSSHRVDRDQEQKAVRVRRKEKEDRRDFSLQYKHISSLPSPPSQSPSSDLIKMLQSHFSLSVQNIIIQHDFWTASCTIRNSTAPGKKMWFRLVLYYITVYVWSLLPPHGLSVPVWGHCMCMFGCMDALTRMMYTQTHREFIYIMKLFPISISI